MDGSIGVGVIGLGESGQLHMEVIQGDWIRRSPLSRRPPITLGSAVSTGKRFAKYILGRERIETPRPPDPGVPEARLIAISDVDQVRLSAASEKFQVATTYTDYRKLLARSDIDAVLICTPPAFHREITLEAARHGKDIFCEKPMAMTSAECSEMIEATEKAGVFLQIGYMLRFSGERGRIVEAIHANALGRPVFFREIMSLRAGGPQPWIHDQKLGGGPLWEVSHCIDFLRYVFGEPETVFAIGGHYKPNKTSAIDTYAVSLIFPSGDRALLGDSYAIKNFGWEQEGCRRHRTEIDVVGPRGYIQFPDTELKQMLTICRYDQPQDQVEQIPWTSEWGANGYKDQMQHFVRCVLRRERPAVSGEDGLKTVQLAEIILKSIQMGEVFKLNASPEPRVFANRMAMSASC